MPIGFWKFLRRYASAAASCVGVVLITYTVNRGKLSARLSEVADPSRLPEVGEVSHNFGARVPL